MALHYVDDTEGLRDRRSSERTRHVLVVTPRMAIADQIVRSLAGDPRYVPVQEDPRRQNGRRDADRADVLVIDHLVVPACEHLVGGRPGQTKQTLVALYGTDERLMTDALAERADGFLFTNTKPYLIADVLDCAQTRHCLVPDLFCAGDPVAQARRHWVARLHWVRRLNHIEHQVLSRLAEGLTNRRIGEDLGVPEHQVKRTVRQVLAQLGLSNRTEAAIFYSCYKDAIDEHVAHDT